MRLAATLFAALLVAGVAPAAADVVVLQPGGGPHVRIFDAAGNPGGPGFFAAGSSFAGGVHVAAGNLTGSAADEIVTGNGPGGEPRVRVHDAQGGQVASFLAYDARFRGGVYVAAGDVDGDGKVEIVTGAGPGGGPHVRVFDLQGNEKGGFFAYGAEFPGGVRVAVGDVTGDGTAEIVTGAGPTGGPHVRVFDARGNEQGGFFAYDGNFGGGVHVGVGDVTGDGRADIVTGAGPTGGPHVRIFDASGSDRGGFFAYDGGFRGGVTVAVGQLVGGGAAEIVTGAGYGGGPHVKVFSRSGAEHGSFFAYDGGYNGGVNVAAATFADGPRVVTGAGVDRAYPILRPGDRNRFVEVVQRRLEALRYWVGPVDGIYSTLTQQAVYAFEKVTGLPIDGVFGADNWAALDVASVPRPRTASGTMIEVDKTRQVLFFVRDGQVLWTFHTSTGTELPYSYDGQQLLADTPPGRWNMFREADGWECGALGCLYMPKYFHFDGIAIHGYESVPPYPASHGCVRVTLEAIEFIWDRGLAPLGAEVWVYGESPPV